jgi:DNA-binding transcriptional LysR family regulator
MFQEPVVRVTSNKTGILEKDSLPLAVYNYDCIYRKWATEALEKINRPFHVAYMSPSISGILATVRSGLAVAPVGLSVAGDDVRMTGPDDGFRFSGCRCLPVQRRRFKKSIGGQSCHPCPRVLSMHEKCMAYNWRWQISLRDIECPHYGPCM